MDINTIKMTPQWSKSKEQIWAERFEQLADVPGTVRFYRRRWFAVATVAAVALLLLLPSVAYLYTKDIVASRGQHLSAVLPDGSHVELNADSRLSYKPYWWRMSRHVELGGEAFFDVAKGETFRVQTANGVVRVLGTSFNVFSRGDRFDVVCLTGRVEVSFGGETTVITPEITPSHSATDWMQGRFNFTDTPLQEVIEEIERQYDITITTPKEMDYYYTGNFSRTKNPEDVLRIIEKPFGLKLKIE